METDHTFFKIPRNIVKDTVDFLAGAAQESLLGETLLDTDDAEKIAKGTGGMIASAKEKIANKTPEQNANLEQTATQEQSIARDQNVTQEQNIIRDQNVTQEQIIDRKQSINHSQNVYQELMIIGEEIEQCRLRNS